MSARGLHLLRFSSSATTARRSEGSWPPLWRSLLEGHTHRGGTRLVVSSNRPSREASSNAGDASTSGGSSEVDPAREALNSPREPTVFSKILSKEIPADIIHEDEKCIAFNDVSPVSPTHFLVIPRKPISMLSASTDSDSDLLGHLLTVARRLADRHSLTDGYRVVINNGRHGCQSVYHLHVHVMGGRQFDWPPG